MKISDILRKKGSKIISIRDDLTVYEAIQTMVENYIGAVLVVNDKGDMVGIFTERDVLRRVAAKGDNHRIREIPLSDVMTRDIYAGHPDTDTRCVFVTMTEKRIRHLPVMEEDRLLGLISIGDIVKAGLGDSQFEAECLRKYITRTRNDE